MTEINQTEGADVWEVGIEIEVPTDSIGEGRWSEEEEIVSAIRHSFDEGHKLSIGGDSTSLNWTIRDLEKRN